MVGLRVYFLSVTLLFTSDARLELSMIADRESFSCRGGCLVYCQRKYSYSDFNIQMEFLPSRDARSIASFTTIVCDLNRVLRYEERDMHGMNMATV